MIGCYYLSMKNFEEAISVGNYPIFYAILDDRIHFEMSTESLKVGSQYFITSKTDVSFILRKVIRGRTSYQFFPTKEEKKMLSSIKLYSRLIVKEYNLTDELDREEDKIEEDDFELRIVNRDTILMRAEKVKW